jgi:enoyl-CoA hydratase/carnithine racemase
VGEYETVELSVEDGIGLLVLDREEALNAVNEQLLDDFVAALDEVDADDGIRALVVTGRGRAFCAGADLSEGGDSFARGDGPFEMPRDADGGGILAARIFDLAKPVIAAINGPAVGIGLTLTLPMDVRMAADSARMGFVFARRGVVPETSSSFFLPRVVGISTACEWCFSGRLFDAAEARDRGLVRSVHPADELVDAAVELAHEMTDHSSSVAVALTRRMLWQMLGGGNPTIAHRLDSEAFHHMGNAPDVKEGVMAFLEKRSPAYPMKVSADLPDFYEQWGRERGGMDPDAEVPDGGAAPERLRLEPVPRSSFSREDRSR